MKLNLGSGSTYLPGYLNVDKYPTGDPDELVDLEIFPWPWEDSSVTDVLMNHVLEHLGQQTETFLKIVQELYRVCADQAMVEINVPHPRHDNFLSDPTHVRPVTVDMLHLFDRQHNEHWARSGVPNTPLAFQLDVDFAVEGAIYHLDEPYLSRFSKGQIDQEELDAIIRERNNVITEIAIKWRVRKA